MCGIAGTVHFENGTLDEMLELLKHRGPDDVGVYRDAHHGVSLGHRRLSIIDLSSAGHQPMSNIEQTIWVTYNGEIYNYKQLTTDLKKLGHTFISHSDTEVLIHGYAEYGKKIFEKIDGMWAVALYDRKAGKLMLSRDPAGEKPLYIYQKGNTFMFSSEINAIKKTLPAGSLTVRSGALRRYLSHGFIYGDETAYDEIKRIPAGSVVTYILPALSVEVTSSYQPQKRFEVQSMDEAIPKFNELFTKSIRETLQADVPIGLFLSGGIDSALVGYHVHEAGANLKAFTIGFPEQSFDESSIASRIAEHIGFPHYVHMMRGEDVAEDVERILDAFGEPFADTAALPAYYMSKLAREHGIKVALAGDGADELFGGYQTHYLPPLAAAYQQTPRIIDALSRAAASAIPTTYTKLGTKEKLTRFLHAARSPYQRAHAEWKRVFTDADLRQLFTGNHHDLLNEESYFDEFFDAVRETSSTKMDEAMKVDFHTFMRASCLVKSDIASMQNSLEVRLPFLNKDMIDFGWFLSTDLKVSPFQTKKLLRRALAPYLSKRIAHIPKKGFVPPLAVWLTTELKSAMLDILSEDHIAKIGLISYSYVVTLIDDHLAGRADNSKKIWALMSLVRFLSTQSHL